MFSDVVWLLLPWFISGPTQKILQQFLFVNSKQIMIWSLGFDAFAIAFLFSTYYVMYFNTLNINMVTMLLCISLTVAMQYVHSVYKLYNLGIKPVLSKLCCKINNEEFPTLWAVSLH